MLTLALAGAGGLALLAAAFTHGHHVGGLQARAALLALPVRRSTWAALLSDLSTQRGSKPARQPQSSPSPAPAPARGTLPSVAPASGGPNALHALRARLGFETAQVAQALGIPIPDVETLEHTPLRSLQLGTVERYVGALGCRLDVVAQHIDGAAVFLEVQP